MSQLKPTERTRLRQVAHRECYDRDTIYSILDEGLVAHVAFQDQGRAFVVPLSYGRMGDQLILHGSPHARFMQVARRGAPLCVNVALLDGLVVAKAAVHHSMNFRSVMVLGGAREIVDPVRKLDAIRALTEHVLPGHWDKARPPSEEELRRTCVVAVPLTEASAKVRSGPPMDEEADLELDHWGGEIPMKLTPQRPLAAEYLDARTAVPSTVSDYRRPAAR